MAWRGAWIGQEFQDDQAWAIFENEGTEGTLQPWPWRFAKGLRVSLWGLESSGFPLRIFVSFVRFLLHFYF